MADKMNFNKHDDERKLDELFETANKGKLNKALKRAKIRSTIRTIMISFIAVGLFSGATAFIGGQITETRRAIMESAVNDYFTIAHPNEYLGKSVRYQDTFGGNVNYSTYKIVQGKVVYTGQQNYSYGFLDPGNLAGIELPRILKDIYTEEDLKKPTYNELGQRQMVFFYPFITYRTYQQDLNLLEEIGEDKNMELALSFDKAYNLSEVKQMIPETVSVAWYWLDDLNQSEKEMAQPTAKNPALIRSERTAYGIKAYDQNGEAIENPEQNFIQSLSRGNQNKEKLKGNSYLVALYKEEFERVYNHLAGADQKVTTEDLKVQGVVVAGSAESLKALRGLPFIKASSLGVVTNKY